MLMIPLLVIEKESNKKCKQSKANQYLQQQKNENKFKKCSGGTNIINSQYQSIFMKYYSIIKMNQFRY